MPSNKSLQPTQVGVVSSAHAGHVVVPAWLSFWPLGGLTREQWLTELSNEHMQSGMRNPRIFLTIRILLTTTALMTLAGGLMGIYGTITQLQAWQGDPVSVIVAVLLSVLLLVGGGCLLRRGIKYDGHPA